MLRNFQTTKEILANCFNKYRRYCDKKAGANSLTEQRYCLLLSPRLTKSSALSPKLIWKWLALYKEEQVLTNSNYLIRRVGTIYTQIVQQNRLGPIKPQKHVPDTEDINCDNFQTDPTRGRNQEEQDLFDKGHPSLLGKDRITPILD